MVSYYNSKQNEDMERIVFFEIISKDEETISRAQMLDGQCIGTRTADEVLKHYHLENDVREIGDVDSFLKYVKEKCTEFKEKDIVYVYQMIN